MFEDAVEIQWQPVSEGGGMSMHMFACTTEESFDIYFCALKVLLCICLIFYFVVSETGKLFQISGDDQIPE